MQLPKSAFSCTCILFGQAKGPKHLLCNCPELVFGLFWSQAGRGEGRGGWEHQACWVAVQLVVDGFGLAGAGVYHVGVLGVAIHPFGLDQVDREGPLVADDGAEVVYHHEVVNSRRGEGLQAARRAQDALAPKWHKARNCTSGDVRVIIMSCNLATATQLLQVC